jgi:hypothetical protein
MDDIRGLPKSNTQNCSELFFISYESKGTSREILFSGRTLLPEQVNQIGSPFSHRPCTNGKGRYGYR